MNLPMQPDEDAVRLMMARLEDRAQRRVVEHRGTRVVWRRFGNGPPRVMLHGGHGSWLHWIRNVDALSRDHALWLPDMPGYGDSDALEGDPRAQDRMERLVDVVCATLDTLVGSSTPVDLGGFSFGGLAAALVAARRGQVRRLALIGAGGHAGARRQTIDLVDWRRLDDRNERLAAFARNLVPFMIHDARRADAMALAIHASACERTRFRSKEIALAGGLREALDRVEAPVLLLWGEHDVTAVPREIGAHLVQGHARRRFEIVPDAGHWAQYEAADAVNARLCGWFDPAG